jgi:outer membrane protein TolC
MRIFKLLLITAMILAAASAGAEEVIKKGELLTLDRAVALALKMQPDVLAAKGTVEMNSARKRQAESAFWPQISASAGYSRVQPAGTSSAVRGLGASTSHSYDQYSTGASAQQMLFDFGRTWNQVSIQGRNVEASVSDLSGTENQVVLNTKQAYYNLLRAKRNRSVADETIRQYQQHLNQAKAFYEVGTRPRFDVTKAEVDLSNAKLNMIRSENAVRLAVVSLNNAMGIPDAQEYEVEDSLSFRKYDITLQDAVATAYAERPELASINARRKAAEESVSLAKKGYFPILTGNAAWSWAGENTGQFASGDGWNAGVSLSIPIFSGFLTKNQISEAKANLYVLTENEESIRQGILFEVQQNFLGLVEAEERIAVAELTVRQATENYEIASGRYNAGVGNPIEVTDAEVALSNAKTSHIQALYDYRTAVAGLEKAMGRRESLK